jgi:large subunit ribosomal protein L15
MGTELHTLTPPEGHRKKRKRRGRGIGSGRGKTSTRGMKGQLARHDSIPDRFEGGQLPIHRRVPKRGFTNIHRVEAHGINVALLEGNFAAGAEVTLEALRERGLVPKNAKIVKLLGNGELQTSLVIRLHRASESARAKVEAAGGRLELLEAAESSAESA